MRYRLDFVPLAVERYFLAVPRASAREAPVQTLVEVLKGREFAQSAAQLPGYDAAKAGARAELAAALNWVRRRNPKRARSDV
jgi:molybdate-binding protein